MRLCEPAVPRSWPWEPDLLNSAFHVLTCFSETDLKHCPAGKTREGSVRLRAEQPGLCSVTGDSLPLISNVYNGYCWREVFLPSTLIITCWEGFKACRRSTESIDLSSFLKYRSEQEPWLFWSRKYYILILRKSQDDVSWFHRENKSVSDLTKM